LIDAALEYFEEFQVRVAGVLDVVRQGLLDVADIAGLKIHGAGPGTGSEDRHPSFSREKILPFVRVLVPVQFADPSRMNRDDRGGDRSGNLEHVRIDDA